MLLAVLCAAVWAGVAQGGIVAAAVQHVGIDGSTPQETLVLNTNRYVKTLVAAAGGGGSASLTVRGTTAPPNLVTFPEFGLLGSFNHNRCADHGLVPYCFPVPAAGTPVNCSDFDGATTTDPLLRIACNTNASIYEDVAVSFNTCERCVPGLMPGVSCEADSGHTANVTHYNTQVVVHRGRVLATYRKFHPFFGSCYTKPQLEIVAFNVSGSDDTRAFGLFTCFDIMFPTPKMNLVHAGVRHFSYSAAIPLVAREAVKLFSWINGVDVVASNNQLGQTSVVVNGTTVAKCETSDGTCVAVARLS